MTTTETDAIKVGDLVVYLSVDGQILGDDRGKVLSVFRTRDSKTLVDVQWERLGMPKRLSIERLAKTSDNDRPQTS